MDRRDRPGDGDKKGIRRAEHEPTAIGAARLAWGGAAWFPVLMLYAILCYNSEEVVGGWSPDEDAAVMARLDAVHQGLSDTGKLGPAARLGFTDTARTLMKGHAPPLVVDGPFAETKEQLLGFYVVDCADMDEATGVAQDLERANPGVGAYEVRPVRLFLPGVGVEG